MKPCVIWLTGLSGAGKSTIAAALCDLFAEVGHPAILLDGDAVRDAIGDENCGHDPESRLKNAYRICRFARMLAEQGFPVIVATMSLYHEIHDWNRKNLPGYFETYLDVSPEVLRKRDPKGLYRRAEQGRETNMVGLHIVVQAPKAPHLRLTNNGDLSEVPKMVRRVFEAALAALGESCDR